MRQLLCLLRLIACYIMSAALAVARVDADSFAA